MSSSARLELTTPSEKTAPAGGTEATAPVVDLLGVLCYGALVAFDNHAADARLAPDLRRRAALSEMAAAELAHYRRLADRLVELGTDPADAMAPFVRALDAYHASTRPRDWWEGLVKAYVGDGIADDFFREVASNLAEPDRSMILDVLHDDRHAAFAVDEVRSAVEADPAIGNRLALWARRLVGEALAQAQAVVAEHAALVSLVQAGDENGGAAGFAAMIERLTTAHRARMAAMHLKN